MGQVTHEQVNLMLRLYELRREARLREAREWYVANFHVNSAEEMMAKFPMDSAASTNIRMVVSYWDMAADIVNRGLIDEELFFEHNGELWLVWDRVRPVVAAWRAGLKNPTIFANLEKAAARMEALREKIAPGTTAAMRQLMEQMRQSAAKAAASGS